MLTVVDFQNILALVRRAPYENLAEARTGVILESKIQQHISGMQKPAVVTEPGPVPQE
jgi:hypothetical protein